MTPSRTIAIGSDMANETTATLLAELEARGIDTLCFGVFDPQADHRWSSVGLAVGEAVAQNLVAQGIVLCWTGTGVAIAANKVNGVRAALCVDGPTAAGARRWNDANVLAMSLRLTTPALLAEILSAWFKSEPSEDAENQSCLEVISGM